MGTRVRLGVDQSEAYVSNSHASGRLGSTLRPDSGAHSGVTLETLRPDAGHTQA